MRTTAQREKRLWLRYACLVLAGIETVLLTLYAAIMVGMGLSSDALGSEIGKGMAGLTANPLLAFALPALVLAVLDRWLLTALTLASLGVPVSILLWRFA
jgi:ABC-type proline/glycine betaine transport system permease subunit